MNGVASRLNLEPLRDSDLEPLRDSNLERADD